MTTHSHHRFAFSSSCLTVLLLCTVGCGGADKGGGADEPAYDSDEEEVVESGSADDGMFPPEKFDEIQRFFDRKRNYMTRCFTEAIDAGEVDKRATGRATVVMTINTRGQPTKVRVSQMQPKSAYLERCIIENVEKWTITTLPKPLEYSYTFGFGTL